MSADIAPALTPEEWETPSYHREGRCNVIGGGVLLIDNDEYETSSSHSDPQDLHAIGALALHGQPFGPTPAMREAVLAAVEYSEIQEALPVRYRADLLGALAFIRALLPPA